jgi:hypothetical protein
MKENLPFIEISIEHLQHSTKSQEDAILHQIAERFRKNAAASVQLVEFNGKRTIRIDFHSLVDFEEEYTRGYRLYEKVMTYVEDGKLGKISNPPSIHPESFDDFYLILRYKANYKQPMRKYYTFSAQLAELVGIQSAMEEIEDGFLWQFVTKTDFELSQCEFRGYEEIREILVKTGLWSEETDQIIRDLF